MKHSSDISELKKMQRASLVKMFVIVMIVVAFAVFGSVAWFTMNREVEGAGVQMTATGENYSISAIDTQNKSNGAFYSPYHELIRKSTGSNAVIWQMTDTNNMNNYAADSVGIKPGSAGSIAFNVTPFIDNINLNFTFEIVGYQYEKILETDEEGKTVKDENGKDKVKSETMTAITSDSSDDKVKALANYLNGHLLLFENKTVENITVDGKTTSRDVYTGLIASDEDMKRVLSKTFSSANTAQQVTIYWVWPETLSTLVDARACNTMKVEQEPFTNETDTQNTRTAILENIQNYPQYYMKNIVRTVEENEPVSYTVKGSTVNELSSTEIVTHYDVYSDLYDQVDNEIGMSVQYLLVKMNVTESKGSDNGSENSASPAP